MIALVLFVLWPIIAFAHWGPEQAGQIGDTFGAVNALVSGGALLMLVWTIHLQRRDLALQRADLELTRKELARSADAHQGLVEEQQRSVDAMLHLGLVTACTGQMQVALRRMENAKIGRMGRSPDFVAAKAELRRLEALLASSTEALERLSKAAPSASAGVGSTSTDSDPETTDQSDQDEADQEADLPNSGAEPK